MLCCAVAFALIACGNSETPVDNGEQNTEVMNNNGEDDVNGEYANGETEGNEGNGANDEVTENNGEDEANGEATGNDGNGDANETGDDIGTADTVEITIAPWFVDFLAEFVGMTPGEIFEGYEFKSAGMNQAGAFVAVMPRSAHEELMSDLQSNLMETLTELVVDDFTPYVRNVTANNNFRNVTVEVDREEYENALFEFTHIVIGMVVLMYQMLDGQDGQLTIEFRDFDGGALITTHTFP